MNAPLLAPLDPHTPCLPQHPHGSRIEARIVRWSDWADEAQIARWDALARAPSTPNPFFEAWYLLPALAAFDPAGTGRLLIVEAGEELIGLMPLAAPRRYGRWPLPHLATWLHPNAFLGAPLVKTGMEMPFWQAMLACLDAQGAHHGALFMHFPAMPLKERLVRSLFAHARGEGRKAVLVMREERAMLQSALGPDAYLEQALTAKKRKELRRQHARLSELGNLVFERREDAQGVDDWIEAFLDLERKGWKGRSGSAMAGSPQTLALFRQSLGKAARIGRLERLSLSLDGRPVAMLANFLTPPGSFSFKTAFDEDFARYSPGVLLQRENLGLLEREGIFWCDSCAAPDHPMIDSLWTERRAIGRISVAIGRPWRRGVFGLLSGLELARSPVGIAQ
ncbi:MAG: GNAT family N-acetyltransferase [Novosphingobium sp.]